MASEVVERSTRMEPGRDPPGGPPDRWPRQRPARGTRRPDRRRPRPGGPAGSREGVAGLVVDTETGRSASAWPRAWPGPGARSSGASTSPAVGPCPTRFERPYFDGSPDDGKGTMMRGLRTVIYRVDDLDRAKAWYAAAFEVEPYFDQPFYVGFQVDGYELGLDPDLSEGRPGPGGSVAYWGVEADVAAASARLIGLGATLGRRGQGCGRRDQGGHRRRPVRQPHRPDREPALRPRTA